MKLLTASPVCCPQYDVEEAGSLFQKLGFSQVELFTSWTGARFQLGQDPAYVRGQWAAFGIRVVSFHLPSLDSESQEELVAIEESMTVAKALGAEVILAKAKTKELLIQHLPVWLEQAEKHDLKLLIQNHKNSCLATVEDYREVLKAVSDPRLGLVLEVGHFAAVWIDWRKAYEALPGSYQLVHLKDMKDGQCVPWGTGEVRIAEIFAQLKEDGYKGTFVVEHEGPPEERVAGLHGAVDYLKGILPAEAF